MPKHSKHHQNKNNNNNNQTSANKSDFLSNYLIPIFIAVGLAIFFLSFFGETTSLDNNLDISKTTPNEPIVDYPSQPEPDMSLTAKDLEQIKARGSTEEEVERQLKNFRDGFGFTRITKPAKVGDGILKLDEKTLQEHVKLFDEEMPKQRCVKFVPASGAASRMFKALFAFMAAVQDPAKKEETLAQFDKGEPAAMVKFFADIESFAFYNDLNDAMASSGGVAGALKARDYGSILKHLLTDAGLSYGSKPKGMLRFHTYTDGSDERRMPIEEHLVEGAQYCRRADDTVHLHFTVSPSHLDGFKASVERVRPIYEARFGVRYVVEYSVQKPSTDTIAVEPNNAPFRLADGSLLFRPAGHGALIENLNDLDADVVFIKNIDNVVPDRLKATTETYKKALGGVLLAAQRRIEAYLEALAKDETTPLSDDRLGEIATFVATELGSTPPDSLAGAPRERRIEYLQSKLNRPLRVCGMVPNSGETGGGPFWVADADGGASIQVVETAQIDINDPAQSSVMSGATHFNPVDLVVSARKPDGSRYNLTKFVDPSAGFISSKSLEGRELRAMEAPGLWNGAMAHQSTIFVEVPLITFNPVKTVNDLLRPQHQPKDE